ncbi:MAG: succinylglutamate desuccinylase/aspartoacylase family protein [Aquisalinus sp.]|nr:succinylglutamate desuccinylase/aspartoacylase family protein [Aquisalinus sp.]
MSDPLTQTPPSPATEKPYRHETVDLGEDLSGKRHTLDILKFGDPGARPKAYLQTALHADELPGMLIMRNLIERLSEMAEHGEITGEVVLVPTANPIGLSQLVGQYMQGRVEEGTHKNFNRAFPNLAEMVEEKIAGRLGDDPAENIDLIRAEMRKALDKEQSTTAFEKMQHTLISNACDADIALDLHADNHAILYLYANKRSWPEAKDLAAEIDARAVLLSGYSGDGSFDEACGGPWLLLSEKFPDVPIPQACLSSTLELRSNNDVSGAYARRDSEALLRFLQRRGCLKGDPGAMPRLLGDAIPIENMHRLTASIEGVVDYKLKPGDTVRKGDLIAEIIPAMGTPEEITSPLDGLIIALHDQTWAWPDKMIGKLVGSA